MFACTEVQEHKFEQNINDGWLFVKVDDTTSSKGEIKNQGSDWHAQFNISHTAKTGKLSLSSETVQDENHKISKKNWEVVTLPHTANVEPLVVLHQWQGVCYYKRKLDLSKYNDDKEIFIRFEGAMHLADVWINGKHIGQHAGGYTPFVFNVTDNIKFSSDNEIVVRLDNRNNPLIPPGKPVEKLDFCYFSGLYRDVKLLVKNKIHISDEIYADKKAGGGVFVTYPEVNHNKAKVHIKTNVVNTSKSDVEVSVVNTIFSSAGKRVGVFTNSLKIESGKNKDALSMITVKTPKLWSPDAPNLYNLVTEIKRDNKLLDKKEIKIGIRNIKYSREKGFELNGKQLRIVASNRHMDYPYVGNAISENAQYRDLFKIKEGGFNAVRLGHYPQDPSVYKFCDELGLLVINPTPGWQFFNKDSLFCEISYQNIRDMVRRDRNHASVVMWETILNESWPPAWWRDKAHNTAHEEYPGDQMYTAGDMYGYYGWDILYNDWSEDHTRPNKSAKPGFIREYGDFEFGGHYSTTRITNAHGEKALLTAAWNQIWSHNKQRAQYPWTVGDGVWSMYDYNRGCCDNICYSGVSDIFRYPKYGYYFYRSQIDIGSPLPSGKMKPELFIASRWNHESTSGKLIVFGNVEEVELSINGKTIARQKPDNGLDTPYAKDYKGRISGGTPFDGGNCNNLKHPPFTFNGVNFKPGKVVAKGFVGGKEVVCQEIITPEKPERLIIEPDFSGKNAQIDDIIIVNVKIIDCNKTICYDYNNEVSLTSLIGAEVIGSKTVKAEAGVASFLIKVKNKVYSLTAKSGDLKHIFKSEKD